MERKPFHQERRKIMIETFPHMIKVQNLINYDQELNSLPTITTFSTIQIMVYVVDTQDGNKHTSNNKQICNTLRVCSIEKVYCVG